MKTTLLLLSVMASCAFFSPASLRADENSERAVAAENKMLRTTIEKLRAEIEGLKKEIEQFKNPPKPAIPVDANSDKTAASPDNQPTSLKGNDILSTAIIKYYGAIKDATTAKQQEAYDIFRKDSSTSVVITFEVIDIRSLTNSVAIAYTGQGSIKTSVNTEYPIEVDVSQLKFTMSKEAAASINRKDKIVVTGVFEGLSNETIQQDRLTSNIRTLVHLELKCNKGAIAFAIRKPAITLNGKSVELAK